MFLRELETVTCCGLIRLIFKQAGQYYQRKRLENPVCKQKMSVVFNSQLKMFSREPYMQ